MAMVPKSPEESDGAQSTLLDQYTHYFNCAQVRCQTPKHACETSLRQNC